MTLQDILELRDQVALLDGVEDPDSAAGCAAAQVLAIHNAIVTGDIQLPAAA